MQIVNVSHCNLKYISIGSISFRVFPNYQLEAYGLVHSVRKSFVVVMTLMV